MKGRAPFATVPGEPNPPSTDPLALLNYALQRHPGSVELVNFADVVKAVALPDLVKLGLRLRGTVTPPPVRLDVEVPFEVGNDLAGPREEQDAYVLICIPRAVMDAMDEEARKPSLILVPPGIVRPS